MGREERFRSVISGMDSRRITVMLPPRGEVNQVKKLMSGNAGSLTGLKPDPKYQPHTT